MTKRTLKLAKLLAELFLIGIDELEAKMEDTAGAKAYQKTDHFYIWSCKESGSVRRASMDLTRALAEMRKP